MPFNAQAAVAHDKNSALNIEQVELDDLHSDEVLVKLHACGICHTDIKFRQILPLPCVFGHEGTGEVVETGSNVKQFSAGDRVILSYPFCSECQWCIKGEPYRCENIPALKFGGQRQDGSKTIKLNGVGISSAFFQQSSFATHAIAREQALVPANTDSPAEILAALPCGVQTGAGAMINVFKPTIDDNVLILGAGAVGLSAVMAAKIMGVKSIICVDLHQRRLDLALELGASHAYNANDDVVGLIKGVAQKGVSIAFDATATESGLKTAISAIGQGGKVGIVSYPNNGVEFSFNTKELFLKVGSLHAIIQGFSVPRLLLPKLIDLYECGRFPVDRLITSYPFEDINKAMHDTHTGAAIKPVLTM